MSFTYRGRCLVAYRSHAKELFDAGEDLAAFASDIARAARAVDEAMKPSKINYGAYADKQCHLHFHIVPKYVDGPSWGSTFEMIAAAEGAAERPRICGTDRADPREARQRFGLETGSEPDQGAAPLIGHATNFGRIWIS